MLHWVWNPTTQPAEVNSATSQVYDFFITDAATGARVWTWSADKGFFQALTSRTIPPNGSLTFTEKWKPAQKGNYVALGSLVSMSHRAGATTAIVVP